MNEPLLLPWHWNPCFPKPLWTERQGCEIWGIHKICIGSDAHAHTHIQSHMISRARTHTHISGALCLQQHSSSVRDGCPGRCGKNTQQQQLLCGCRHAISPRQARGVVALWRIVEGGGGCMAHRVVFHDNERNTAVSVWTKAD